MSEIYILTGKIGSGKTTFITGWLKGKKNAAGIITLTKNGKRILWNLSDNEERIFEVDNTFKGPVQIIGQFVFDEEAFLWSENKISSIDFSKTGMFILDEAGLLELNKKGFYQAILNLLQKTNNMSTKIILIVREQCVEKIIELFNLNDVKICTKENFNSSFLTFPPMAGF